MCDARCDRAAASSDGPRAAFHVPQLHWHIKFDSKFDSALSIDSGHIRNSLQLKTTRVDR